MSMQTGIQLWKWERKNEAAQTNADQKLIETFTSAHSYP